MSNSKSIKGCKSIYLCMYERVYLPLNRLESTWHNRFVIHTNHIWDLTKTHAIKPKTCQVNHLVVILNFHLSMIPFTLLVDLYGVKIALYIHISIEHEVMQDFLCTSRVGKWHFNLWFFCPDGKVLEFLGFDEWKFKMLPKFVWF